MKLRPHWLHLAVPRLHSSEHHRAFAPPGKNFVPHRLHDLSANTLGLPSNLFDMPSIIRRRCS